MGPNKNTDAQNMQAGDPLQQVLLQLDRPLDLMDTDWIDTQADCVPDSFAPSFPAYEQTMRQAVATWRAEKAHSARSRYVKRASAVAASLLMVAVATFGVANAFQWNGFLRMLAPQDGSLSFQTVTDDNGISGSAVREGMEVPPPPPNDTAQEPPAEKIKLDSAEKLLALSTTGDKAFKPLLERYTFQSGTLYTDGYSNMLFLSFLDGVGNNLNIQIDTINEEYADVTAGGITFEIDEGSQRMVRIGDSTVITCTNMDLNTVQWIIEFGYCHIWSKASHEELLNIAEILLDAGLKPV